MVFERFEVVSAPVEERLVDSIASQAAVLLDTIQIRFADAKHIASDRDAIERVTKVAVKLVMPGTVPFLLFAAAFVLRVFYIVLLRVRSRRMIDRVVDECVFKSTK